MIKPRLYKGGSLCGLWEFTVKLDGIRALRTEKGTYVSRAGKPLYGLERMQGNDLEIFAGSWEQTVSLLRTQATTCLCPSLGYSLSPLDPRLYLYSVYDPAEEQILKELAIQVKRGNEGLVLRQEDKWLKVKPFETYDVRVTDLQEGTNKNVGKLGAFLTDMGKVGTGFTDQQRQEFISPSMVGKIIEVSCMSLTPSGKFRHPRFIRVREDKDEVS